MYSVPTACVLASDAVNISNKTNYKFIPTDKSGCVQGPVGWAPIVTSRDLDSAELFSDLGGTSEPPMLRDKHYGICLLHIYLHVICVT